MLDAIADDVRDVVIECDSRRGRIALLALAIALSTGALVASGTVNMTASQQIANDLAASMVNSVTLSAKVVGDDAESPYTTDSLARVTSTPMVIDAGFRLDLATETLIPKRTQQSPVLASSKVLGATSGYFTTVGAHSQYAWMLDEDDPHAIAFVGNGLRESLYLPDGDLNGDYSISLDGRDFAVLDVIDSDNGVLDNSIVIPFGISVDLRGSDLMAQLSVKAEPGAAAQLSETLPTIVRPDDPGALKSTLVDDLLNARRGVDSQFSRLSSSVGVLLLVLTVFLVANSMIGSVISRVSEIGLRRALGYSSLRILRIFLLEGALIGILGGFAGSAIGLWTTIIVAKINGWGVILPLWAIAAGPIVGSLTTIVASIYPSIRAARIDPATAIRAD